MPISEDSWRMAGGALAHQLWGLVSATGVEGEPNVAPTLVLRKGGQEKTVRLIGVGPEAVTHLLRKEDPDAWLLCADARMTTPGGQARDALVVDLHEGHDEAKVALPYTLPFRLGAPMGVPRGVSAEAFLDGLRQGAAWAEIERHVGPLLDALALARGPDPSPVAPPHRLPQALGPIRVQDGRLIRLFRDGSEASSFPLPGLRLSVERRRRPRHVAVGGALWALGGLLILWPGGLLGGACASPLALFGLASAVLGLRRTLCLVVEHPDGVALWSLGNDEPEGLWRDFVDRIPSAEPGPPPAGARRERTRAALAAAGHRAPPRSLPEVDDGLPLRPAPEVARRALALALAVAPAAMGSAAGDTPPPFADFEARLGDLIDGLTPVERAFLQGLDPSSADALSWRFEAAATLFWALGWIDARPRWDAQADPAVLLRFLHGQERLSAQVEQARLRPASEILDRLDEVVCGRWILVQARLRDQRPPPGLHADVLLEQQHALCWLTGFMQVDSVAWDDVACHT